MRVSFVLMIVFPGFKIVCIYFFSTESLELIDIYEGLLNLFGDIFSFEILEFSDYGDTCLFRLLMYFDYDKLYLYSEKLFFKCWILPKFLLFLPK